MAETYWQNIERIFNQTIFLPPEQRYKHALKACGENEELFREVIELLEEAENSENFLSDPVYPIGNKILATVPSAFLDKSDFAHYEILSVLGRGGSSVVFLAKDKTLERNVALKILPYTLPENDEIIARFLREAKAASALSHPNVIHIYEFGKAEDRFYIAMEYVKGKSLRDLMKQNLVEPLFALNAAIQILKALIVSHRANIIHRDIKPENILVTEENTIKVLDFGLAKTFSENQNSPPESELISSSLLTKPGLVIGTVGYMSPEQIRGQRLDSRTDLWSLGVTLYEMLVGERPFTGETQTDIQAKILLAQPDFPAKLSATPNIVAVLSKLLNKKIELRYKNSLDLLNDLEFIYEKLLKKSRKKKIQLSFLKSNVKNSDGKQKSFGENFVQKLFRFGK